MTKRSQKELLVFVFVIGLLLGTAICFVYKSIEENKYNCYIDENKIYDFIVFSLTQLPEHFQNITSARDYLEEYPEKSKMRINLALMMYNLC